MAKLYFRYGVMGCGKTTHLLQVASNYERCNRKFCIIKPEIDTKNGQKISSRIGLEADTDLCFGKNTNLCTVVRQKFADVSCVLVDEAQFLTKKQVDELLDITVELQIPVFAYGLRLNSQLTDKGFEGATRLLQLAHEIEELKTICQCGEKAIFNARFLDGKFIDDGPSVVIDDGSTAFEYRAICPACYKRYKQGIAK